MAAITLQQALRAPVITRAISTIKTPQSRFQRFLGMLPGGPNVNPVGGRLAAWDIFDQTRELAKGRAPDAGPATQKAQPIGIVQAVIYRSHEKVYLTDEKLHRNRPLGGQWGTVDVRGARYIAQQQQRIAQRFFNTREFMVSRMLRGGFAVLRDGDDWLLADTDNGSFNVDFQIPAGNKEQLDLLGAGDIIDASWSAAGTDVIGHCLEINAAFEELHGRPLRHVWINSVVLAQLLVNTGLKNVAGTANVVFSDWRQSPEISPEGIPDTGHEVVFRGLPWLMFHVYDGGLNVATAGSFTGTFTKFLDNTHAIFLPDPGDWTELIEGSEMVRETVVSPPVEQFGIHAWTEPTTQPAGFEMIAVDNTIPALMVPKAVAYGEVNITT